MKKTILLAEYNRIQRLASERILRKAGYVVLNAEDGEETLRVARAKIPDVVILDVLLPKLRGREVMRLLQLRPATAQIPVLFFSGLPQLNEARLKKEGAAGYFAKSRLESGRSGEKELIQLIEEIIQQAKIRADQRPRPWAQSSSEGN
jgi:CheY-like chemotaxis protein